MRQEKQTIYRGTTSKVASLYNECDFSPPFTSRSSDRKSGQSHFRQKLAEATILCGKIPVKRRGRQTTCPSSASSSLNDSLFSTKTTIQIRPVPDVLIN